MKSKSWRCLIAGLLSIVVCSGLCSCGKDAKDTRPVVKLSVWCEEEQRDVMQKIVDDFKKANEADADLRITIGDESEQSCKETVLANPKAAADVYSFPDDQFEELYQNGTLRAVSYEKDKVIKENGGSESQVIQAVSRGGELYAYPQTAGNGYFLYYDSRYLTEEDVKSLDRILEVAQQNNKKFVMDFSSGWYLYSFFKGAGLHVGINAQGSNDCDWNATSGKYTGEDVANALLTIAGQDGFSNNNDRGLSRQVEEGDVIAAVNGAWNENRMKKAFGKGYAATKLPTYTLAGEQVQMASVCGYKVMGVSAYTKEPQWAMRLARWITNGDNQLYRFEKIGECPSNVEVRSSEEVKRSKAIMALAEQEEYGSTLYVAQPFWDAATVFGTEIAAGNRDGKDVQKLLDDLVSSIKQKP